MRVFILRSCMLCMLLVAAAFGVQASLVQALASPPETGFNTHLRGGLLTPSDFTADVDDMVNHQQKLVRPVPARPAAQNMRS
jgi:hypothetical protein